MMTAGAVGMTVGQFLGTGSPHFHHLYIED
jgi:hypothetical protein